MAKTNNSMTHAIGSTPHARVRQIVAAYPPCSAKELRFYSDVLSAAERADGVSPALVEIGKAHAEAYIRHSAACPMSDEKGEFFDHSRVDEVGELSQAGLDALAELASAPVQSMADARYKAGCLVAFGTYGIQLEAEEVWALLESLASAPDDVEQEEAHEEPAPARAQTFDLAIDTVTDLRQLHSLIDCLDAELTMLSMMVSNRNFEDVAIQKWFEERYIRTMKERARIVDYAIFTTDLVPDADDEWAGIRNHILAREKVRLADFGAVYVTGPGVPDDLPAL